MLKAGAAPAGGGQTQAEAPAPAAGPLVAVRASVVRSAPVASAEVLMNLPVGREVRPKAAKADGGWWEIDVAGSPGYVRAADLGPPGSAPAPVQTAAKGKGGRAAPAANTPPPPPAPAGPTNIRAYNQQVIAARDTGKGAPLQPDDRHPDQSASGQRVLCDAGARGVGVGRTAVTPPVSRHTH